MRIQRIRGTHIIIHQIYLKQDLLVRREICVTEVVGDDESGSACVNAGSTSKMTRPELSAVISPTSSKDDLLGRSEL